MTLSLAQSGFRHHPEPRHELFVELGLGQVLEDVGEAAALVDPLQERLVVPAASPAC